MQNLPCGYYAVCPAAEGQPPCTTFYYKGVPYAVTPGKNLFSTLPEAAEAATQTPRTILPGLCADDFATPVVLFSEGVHSSDKFYFKKSLTLLGQNAGVSPNLPACGNALPEANPDFNRNASILEGSYWYGILRAVDPAATHITIDGFVFKDTRVIDSRTSGECTLAFKNIAHLGPSGNHLYHFYEAEGDLRRRVQLQNLRVVDLDNLGYGNSFLRLHAQEVTISGLCFANTALVFGFTGISKGYATGNGKFTVQNSYFANLRGENGLANTCAQPESAAFDLCITGCTFVDAARPNEAPLQPHLPNPNCRLTLTQCQFINTRGTAPAVEVRGNANLVCLTDCSFSGFTAPVATAPVLPGKAPDFVDADPRQTDCADAHRVVKGDFAALDRIYANRRVYYGDQHVHTSCGGTSDGKTPMAQWPQKMDALGLDFAAVVDHKQMRGFFLPEWDEERFIIGTEPATRIKDLNDAPYGQGSVYTAIHYNMLFPHKYGLAMVLANFPAFQFQGDELNGSFKYAHFTKAEFKALFDYVTSIGGMMVHPHPKTMLSSRDPLDYYFGEGMYLETLYETYDSHFSFKNYDLWVELLALGKRVYTSAGSDTHGEVTNAVVSAFYTKEKSGRAFFDQMKTGDYAVGIFGMQMCIDDVPMGGQVVYRPGQTLTLRIADVFARSLQANTAYELRVYTDQGQAFAAMFNGQHPQALALEVQQRKFYRAEVFDLTHGYRVGIGNPIWLV